MAELSIRRLWTMYKRIAIRQGLGASKRDPLLAQGAFYGGARGVLQVLAHMMEHGDYDALHRPIERQGRQIRAIHGLKPRARRH